MMFVAAFPLGRKWPRVIGMTKEILERNCSTSDIIASAREWRLRASADTSEKELAKEACVKIDSSLSKPTFAPSYEVATLCE